MAKHTMPCAHCGRSFLTYKDSRKFCSAQCRREWGYQPKRTDAQRWERFWAKVDKTESCWNWTGALSNGYGSVNFEKGKLKTFAHRLSYTALVGPIPDGLMIDHLCRNPRCVRPDHLEVVTNRENVRRGIRGMTAAQRIAFRGRP